MPSAGEFGAQTAAGGTIGTVLGGGLGGGTCKYVIVE